jgi:4-amino-4-deoxy-L-arabinose transferase-like glycosyltransferase
LPVQLPPHRQPPAERTLLIAVVAAALARLATLGMYPLVDTTEARYAEIARNMAVLGDWVTPWFRDGLPFWGKPPLSFWLTAASFKAIGINAFAARLPHWICGCLLAWLVWGWLARRSRYTAAVAVALIGSSLLFLASAGIVMTDMTLALGTTLMLRGFWLGLHGAPAERRREQWIFFLGLAIGLMAKGPIAALLAGIPIAVCAGCCASSPGCAA